MCKEKWRINAERKQNAESNIFLFTVNYQNLSMPINCRYNRGRNRLNFRAIDMTLDVLGNCYHSIMTGVNVRRSKSTWFWRQIGSECFKRRRQTKQRKQNVDFLPSRFSVPIETLMRAEQVVCCDCLVFFCILIYFF